MEILESDENKNLDENEAKICLLVRRGYARLLWYDSAPVHCISYRVFEHFFLLPSELNRYEEALLQLKKVNVKDSIEDLFSLGRIFFKLGKYQQCSKSQSPVFTFSLYLLRVRYVPPCFCISLSVFESALNVADESEISMVYTAIGMAQSKLNIQESITWFFKR